MKINRNALALLAAISLFTALTSQNSVAATNGFVIPTFRASAGSQAGYWEIFTSAYNGANLPDQPGATISANVIQTNPNGFLTSSGNIYNFTDANAFAISNTAPAALGTVVLQMRTAGSEISYGSVNLNYTDVNGPHTVAPLFRYELDRGAGVSSLWQWDLTGLGVTSYNLTFVASGSSMSLDSLTLDTATQFAPAFIGQPFAVRTVPANIARWMYPFNASPANRTAASVFGAFASTGSFDTRDAQYLLGWTTTNLVPSGFGAKNYLVRRVRVTLTISTGNQYAYSGILRDYRSYFPTNDPRYVPSASITAPVELFGVGYRGGYTAATYLQASPWAANPANGFYTNRAAYSAGFDTNGILVDVSNNVGDDGTNEVVGAFEVAPFAVGQNTNVLEGQLMPINSQLTFDLNLDDPLIYGYVQNALNGGNLNLMASTLLSASFTGAPNYPNFYTIFNSLADPDQYPVLDITGELVRTNVDSDADGLPDDWENFSFGSLGNAAAGSLTGDQVSNLSKYIAGTNPTNATANLRVLSIQRQGGGAKLNFNFAPGRQYSVQSSTNLLTWQTVTSPVLNYSSAWLAKTLTNAVYPSPVYAVWSDTNAVSGQHYYRIGAQ